MKTLIFVLTIISFLLLFSCNDTVVMDNVSEEIKYSRQHLLNDASIELRFRVAKAISELVGADESVLHELYENCTKSYEEGNSDYDFFISSVSNSELKSIGSGSFLQSLASRGAKISEEDLCLSPGLAILMVGDESVRKFNKRIYVDDDLDDEDVEQLIYYFENGKLGVHKIKDEPSERTFVVRISETYVDPKKEDFKIYTDDATPWSRLIKVGVTKCGDEIYNISQTPIDDDSKGIGNKANPCGLPCDRECYNGTENLKRFRTTHTYESWFKGTGEFYWYFLVGDDVAYTLVNGVPTIIGNPTQAIYSGIFAGVKKNITYVPHYQSIVWTLNSDIDRMRYAGFESDGNRTYPVSLALTGTFLGITATFQVSHNICTCDDVIGDFQIFWCQAMDPFGLNSVFNPAGFQYNYGAVSTWLNER